MERYMKKQKIIVTGIEVKYYEKEDITFISLTDIAKKFNANTDVVIQNWLRTADTLDYLGLWETMYNPHFNEEAFKEFRLQAGSGGFFLSPKQWIEKTGAMGMESRTGRGGGTYAHRDIALEFCSSLSAAFRLYMVKEFQRLKEDEAERKGLTWNVYRLMAKANYLVHTEAVRENKVPMIDWHTKKEAIHQASEADLINMVVFGCTAKQWRGMNPELKGNIRDHASALELLVLANMEILNTKLLEDKMDKQARFAHLQATAAHQLSLLANAPAIKRLEERVRGSGGEDG